MTTSGPADGRRTPHPAGTVVHFSTSGGSAIRYDTTFAIRYETVDAVPIADIIASLQGVELALRETAALLPSFFPGMGVEKVEIAVREIAQASPLREMFFVAMVVTYQKGLEDEVPNAISQMTGAPIPDSLDTIVTFLTLTILFYGIGAIKTLVLQATEGPAKRQLDRLIAETANLTGISEEDVRRKLDARYADKRTWKRLQDAVIGVFRPSKNQSSVAVDINGQTLPHEVMRDIPADYIIEHAEEHAPSRNFENVPLEIHAQDKDHGGKGWAAVIPNLADRRIPLKLMTGVPAADLWGTDRIRGDVTVIYERVADGMRPKAIHLHEIVG